MTHSESVAMEHIRYRLANGASLFGLAIEARECLRLLGCKPVAHLHPAGTAPAWAIEKAFARAFDAMQMEKLGRAAA